MWRVATIECGRSRTTYAIILAVWTIDCHVTMGEMHARIAGSRDLGTALNSSLTPLSSPTQEPNGRLRESMSCRVAVTPMTSCPLARLDLIPGRLPGCT